MQGVASDPYPTYRLRGDGNPDNSNIRATSRYLILVIAVDGVKPVYVGSASVVSLLRVDLHLP